MASQTLWVFSGLLVFLAGQALGTIVTTTDGTLGEECGASGRKCLWERSHCSGGACMCPIGFGDGFIQCYKNNTVRTELYNDPHVKTYDGDKIALNLPCRYLLTHTLTHLKNRQRVKVGTCEVKLSAFQQKVRGKIYVAGLDMAIKLMYNDGTIKNTTFRMTGLAEDGLYTFSMNATDDKYLPDGPFDGSDDVDINDPTTGLKIKFLYQNEDNLAILNAKKCGWDLQFRGYDRVRKLGQLYVPHLAYGIRCSFHPVFLSPNHVVAIPPHLQHGGNGIAGVAPLGFTNKEKIFLRALNSGAEQNSPAPNPQCPIVRDKMNACSLPNLHLAFDYCMFLLEVPKFMRCYDDTDSGEKIMELFGECVDIFCASGDCDNVKNLIKVGNCHLTNPYTVVDLFLASTDCMP